MPDPDTSASRVPQEQNPGWDDLAAAIAAAERRLHGDDIAVIDLNSYGELEVLTPAGFVILHRHNRHLAITALNRNRTVRWEAHFNGSPIQVVTAAMLASVEADRASNEEKAR